MTHLEIRPIIETSSKDDDEEDVCGIIREKQDELDESEAVDRDHSLPLVPRPRLQEGVQQTQSQQNSNRNPNVVLNCAARLVVRHFKLHLIEKQ